MREKIEIDGLTYEVKDNTARLIKGKNTPDVIVPANVSGAEVTAIGEKAFIDCNKIHGQPPTALRSGGL
ncbi:MAG: hypothetical protein LUE12_06165 [Ruminococcus sp.]|nr:hypothetical protein [Ruminococcus sp.]